MQGDALMDDTIFIAAMTALATSLASKGAEGPAHTLNLLWQATFGRVDKPLEEYLAKRNHDKIKYIEEIDKETSKIPVDKIKQEIDISLVGPALEASKYYIGNAVLRSMFDKLIAASLDQRHNGEVHHAFVEIIKQMNPLDAQMLSDLKNPSYVLYYLTNQHGRGYVYENLYMSDRFQEPFEESSLAISNLERLGLIHAHRYRHGLMVGTGAFLDSMVKRFKKTDYYKQMPEPVDPNFTVDQLEITTLGLTFRDICL